jgi:hypothetical protein
VGLVHVACGSRATERSPADLTYHWQLERREWRYGTIRERHELLISSFGLVPDEIVGLD